MSDTYQAILLYGLGIGFAACVAGLIRIVIGIEETVRQLREIKLELGEIRDELLSIRTNSDALSEIEKNTRGLRPPDPYRNEQMP